MTQTVYLAHHGIKGQKWGVRRFQNPDGSYTSAGKKRYSDSGMSGRSGNFAPKVSAGQTVKSGKPSSDTKMNPSDKKVSLKKAASIGGTALAIGALGYAAYKHPELTEKALYKISYTSTSAMLKIGDKAASTLSKAADKAVDAAITAAMGSLGAMAVSKISEKLAAKETDTEQQKAVKKIATDAATAAVTAAANTKVNSKDSTSSNSSALSQERKQDVNSKVGEPSKKSNAKQDPKWSTLFKDADGKLRPEAERTFIKKLAEEGYDINQIVNYLQYYDGKG